MKSVYAFIILIILSSSFCNELSSAAVTAKSITISKTLGNDLFKKESTDLEDDSHIHRKFWAVISVACLLMVVVILLMNNAKRSAVTNAKLLELNNEITRQKDNLNLINHHLEEIINDRTKDLQAKNKQLSEYSSYLSHQIRGPIATLKGLMNLQKENLIDQKECIEMMDKCVSEIDEKIIEMSAMLHHEDNA